MYYSRLELIRSNWILAMSNEKFLFKFSFNLVTCFAIYLLLAHYLFMNRFRGGTVLDDPILKLFLPVNFSWPIFFLIYSAVLLFLYYVIPDPSLLTYAARAFTALFALRVLFILLTPMGPPRDTILLQDPFVDKVIGFKEGC